MGQSVTVKMLIRTQISERTCLQEREGNFSNFSWPRLADLGLLCNLLVSKLWCHEQKASLQHTHCSGHWDGVKIFHPDLCYLGKGNTVYITVWSVWNAAQAITQIHKVKIHRLFLGMWRSRSQRPTFSPALVREETWRYIIISTLQPQEPVYDSQQQSNRQPFAVLHYAN